MKRVIARLASGTASARAAASVPGLLALSTVAILAQARPAVAPEIAPISPAFTAAFNAKDAAALGAFYTESAVLMPPGGPLAKGRAAIQAAFQQQFAVANGLKLTAIEAKVSGDQAFEAGTSTMTIGAGAQAQTARGKYVVIYQRVGGAWKIVYDIFNDDGAPTPAPASAPAKAPAARR